MSAPNSFSVDWNTWTPKEKAVLCFVFDGDQVLLIEKKRGLGAGKVNAPGGRIDLGETAQQAAIRETQEEVGITPIAPVAAGELSFQFIDGYSLHCTVFHTSQHTGSMMETNEANPFWCKLSELPYYRMWEDDRHWLPLMLKGEKFNGKFVFDGERMVGKILTE